ncbi:MAG: hypothetical protein ABW076_00945 [Candidatus Thiodiazotropha sp.]
MPSPEQHPRLFTKNSGYSAWHLKLMPPRSSQWVMVFIHCKKTVVGLRHGDRPKSQALIMMPGFGLAVVHSHENPGFIAIRAANETARYWNPIKEQAELSQSQ